METKNGYNSYELTSAFQKFIRRGMEYEAGYVALELAESGLLPIILSRCRVIAYEDIGPANPQAILLTCQALDDTEKWHKIGNGAWRLSLMNAIQVLCRSDKSRDADNMVCVLGCNRKNGEKITIPDYCYDKHTWQGKKKGRGMKHFFEEAAILSNDVSDPKYQKDAQWLMEEAERNKVDIWSAPLFQAREEEKKPQESLF